MIRQSMGRAPLWWALTVLAVGLFTLPPLTVHAEDPQSRSPERELALDPAYAGRENPILSGGASAPIEAPPPPATDKPVDPTRQNSGRRVSVLVHLEPGLQFYSVEREQVKQFAEAKGAFTRYEYKTVLPNVINLRDVPVSALAELEARPGVVRVELDVYHPSLVKLDESTPLVRALDTQLAGAGLNFDGSGIRVCVADTGIDMDHVMYASRIDAAASWDFANNDSNPDDDNGHGSHVAGIAVGGTGLTVDLGCEGPEPFQGMAPGATLIGAKILNSFGGGSDSDIIAGIDHCADQSPSGGRADVINLSIGTGNFSSGACTHSWAVASNNAVANGVVVVAASGNENNVNSMGSPACGANVIAVGATYKDDYPNCEDATTNFNWGSCSDSSPGRDQVVCFSNESDFLDVSAPGSVILSASNAAGGNSITGQSGTSMASPMVAGLAALVLDADATLTPAQVRQVIRDGAIDMGPVGFDRGYGYGRIDAINTLNQIGPCTVDADCDDGVFCNGAETCAAGSCSGGTIPCPGGICDEGTNSCQALAFEWNMDTNPGWTLQGQWAWGQPTGGGGQHGGPDPTGGSTGANVLGYNLAGDYANNLPETHATTTAINCSNLTNVTLRFQRWLGVEQPIYDRAYVRVSNNGVTWTTIWENTIEVADGSWTAQEFDISSVADNQATVFVRWTQGTTDSSWQYCGWNIDDVQIFATAAGPTCTDGVLNQNEERIDCGGVCAPCDCLADVTCDDGVFCNGSETCDAFGTCQSGSAPGCDDGVGCTDDSCNVGTDSCDNVANDTTCDNGVFCDGAETCDAVLDCQGGTPPDCSDGVGCTDDSCNTGTDSCDNVANNANCDNGLYCDGAETCDAVQDCVAGTDPCGGGTCDESGDVCGCTLDAHCDDGTFCNGAETCNVGTGTCQAGIPPSCDDGVGCTVDACDVGADACDNAPSDGLCDDGAFCNGAETCDAVLDCQAGTDPCAGGACDEGTDTCPTAGNVLWMSFRSNTTIPGVGTVADEDVVAYDDGSGTWSLIFDGSDVGLGGVEIDGFTVLPGGDFLMTFTGSTTLGGTSVADEDVVRFAPTTLGPATSGTFSLYFDGSDVGLSSGGEDLDALSLTSDGRMIFSTLGSMNAGGSSGADEDLWIFNATSLGTTTSGSFERLFDGSDVGLNNSSSEDIDAATYSFSTNRILFSTVGNFSVAGASGADEDVLEFTPTALGNTTAGSFTLLYDLSALGIISSEDIGSLRLE